MKILNKEWGINANRRLRPVPLIMCGAAIFVGYPLGAMLLNRYHVDGFAWGELAGLILAGLAFVSAAVISSGTAYWRIIHGKADRLDERELKERNFAYQVAYRVLLTVSVLGVGYLALAGNPGDELGDGLWLPTNYDQWSYVLWGLVLFALTFPMLVLAWRDRPLDSE